jgi:hypothetical protein
MSSPPVLVWTSWSSTCPSSKSASARGVVLQPGSPFQIWNAGQDAGGFDAIATCCEIVLSQMHLSLDNGELIMEMMQLVVLSTVALDFGGSVPVVEVGNGAMEGVIGGGRAIE